jgi:hypothetical protein
MAPFALTLGDRVSWKLAKRLLWPMVAAGVASVVYWAWTEQRGVGDLRPYGLVQFLPIILMPLLLLTFPGSRPSAMWLWYTFAAYVVSKVAEHFDGPLHDAVGLSVHSISISSAPCCAVCGVRDAGDVKWRNREAQRRCARRDAGVQRSAAIAAWRRGALHA